MILKFYFISSFVTRAVFILRLFYNNHTKVSGPAVEFFNPKLRHELEKKDAEALKKSGLKGAAPGGDAWVWLTAYSRIPVSFIDFYYFLFIFGCGDGYVEVICCGFIVEISILCSHKFLPTLFCILKGLENQLLFTSLYNIYVTSKNIFVLKF